MTTTNHDDQRRNLVKFIQRCQMSLTVAKRLHIWREIAQLGQFTPCIPAQSVGLKTDHETRNDERTLQRILTHFIFAINVLVTFSEDGMTVNLAIFLLVFHVFIAVDVTV